LRPAVLASALLFVLTVHAAAAGPARIAPPPRKPAPVGGATGATAPSRPDSGRRVGGDTVETAVVIPSIPFADTGNTCGFVDDYDESCPYTGSTSPDVVYAFTPSEWTTIDVVLCDSAYDTKVYIYENEVTPLPLVCNDDAIGCGPSGYQSRLQAVALTPGNTYYIVVDGYTGDCGDYLIHIYDSFPCVFCPPFPVFEDEPECIDPEYDVHNGGCDSDPPVFDVIAPTGDPLEICGTSGTYYDGVNLDRDTDWYEFDLAHPATITVSCEADFDVLVTLIDGSGGCPAPAPLSSFVAPFCQVGTLTETIPAGTWWIRVGPDQIDGVPCGSDYTLVVEGLLPASITEGVSWSTIKAIYRER
jgi:hypothetical protein